MAGMERDASAACPNSKRKAEAAMLDEGLSDGENAVAFDSPAAAAEFEAAPQRRGRQGAVEEEAAPRRPKAIMSQEWIDSVLARKTKPLPLTERLLRNPTLAAVFRSHEESRARFAEYQDWIRRELEAKGYVEVGDDYDETCELLQAVHTAAFYGREDEEKAAMAKLAALRRA